MVETTVVMFSAPTLGRGSDDLGGVLLRNFLRMLKEGEPPPATLIFMNGGVRLTTEGTPVAEELAALEGLGVELLSCGTCLDFFSLRDKVVAGRASNMAEIFSRLYAAGKVLTV